MISLRYKILNFGYCICLREIFLKKKSNKFDIKCIFNEMWLVFFIIYLVEWVFMNLVKF